MQLHELDFDFPAELIAQEPAEPRDSCRLMYLPAEGPLQHRVFSDLPALLRAGDTLVFNDSRVLPARLEACKPTGGKVEVLFLRPLQRGLTRGAAGAAGSGSRNGAAPFSDESCDDPCCDEGSYGGGELWEVLARPSHRLRPGMQLSLAGGEGLLLRSLLGEGRWVVEGSPHCNLVRTMEKYGRLPLPPYIKTYSGDTSAYQTVYAAHPGSAAAPTAGLHFTPGLLAALVRAGVSSAFVTLHVGLDTFQPIREEVVEDHRIHREVFSVRAESLAAIGETRRRGGRVVAVGTTATRVLETVAALGYVGEGGEDRHEDLTGSTQIFITPGYRFKGVDVLLTNFHLPRSTVLAMVMAFTGSDRLRESYADAIQKRYRFFSFGDAMLIEPEGAAYGGAAHGS